MATRSRRPKSRLAALRPQSVPYSSIAQLSQMLGVETNALLDVIGLPERTAARRRQEGQLKADEADRLLRVARVLDEAMRIFGSQERAAEWLNTPTPALYKVTPFSLLESDA